MWQKRFLLFQDKNLIQKKKTVPNDIFPLRWQIKIYETKTSFKTLRTLYTLILCHKEPQAGKKG